MENDVEIENLIDAMIEKLTNTLDGENNAGK
jgi:hypothetical protein